MKRKRKTQSANVNETVQALLQTLVAHTPPPLPPLPHVSKDVLVEVVARFKNHNPPTFSCFTNPIIVEDWMRSIKMTFELLTCSNAQKVNCASHMLRDSAIHQWDMTKRVYVMLENLMTWAQFKELFNEKYYQLYVQNTREMEFLNLK